MELDEKLEQFISNQRKGNRFMLIVVIVFIILAAVTLYLATQLSDTEKELKTKYNELSDMKKKLEDIAAQSFTIQESLTRQLGDAKTNYDTLLKKSKLNDSIYYTLKYSDKSDAKARLQKFIKSMVQSKIDKRTIIYIQYQPNMATQKDEIFTKLSAYNNLKIEPAGIIDLSYDNEIRYFNEEDKDKANEILGILGNDFRIVFIDKMESPLNQIEVWVGRPKRMDIQQQYDKMKGK